MNLRKDHCRCPTKRATREPVRRDPGLGWAPARPEPPSNQSPAPQAPRTSNRAERERRRPGNGADRPARAPRVLASERLSATDISALASMKNVAKCDTWCELQNPVNHRVFERKLRPKPLGRGHACLGVTQRRLRPRHGGAGADDGLPRAPLPVGRKRGPTPRRPRSTVAERAPVLSETGRARVVRRGGARPQGRPPVRDPRSGGATR